MGSYIHHPRTIWSQQGSWGLSSSHNWKNLSKAPRAARGARPRRTNLLDWEQELTEKSEKPVLRALATGVERKDRQEKGSLSLL